MISLDGSRSLLLFVKAKQLNGEYFLGLDDDYRMLDFCLTTYHHIPLSCSVFHLNNYGSILEIGGLSSTINIYILK